MTDERLAELEGLAGAATPGPWKATEGEMCKEYFQVIDVPTGCEIIDKENGGCASDPCPDDVFFSPENARFIAAARTAVPELVAEVRRLREAERQRHGQKCEACGLHGPGAKLVSIHVTNGVFCVCPLCLEQVNRKNPELASLRAEVERLRADLAKCEENDPHWFAMNVRGED
jgi:hypothetical protein